MPASDETTPLMRAPILVVTRFSFVGQSGWQGDASRDPDLLFRPERLRQRLALFTSITLPSLGGQSDKAFHHLVLTSDRLPDWAMAELQTACSAAYGDDARFTVLAHGSAPARRPLRGFMQTRFDSDCITQVVLDDDDGLAIDFVARLRADLGAVEAEMPELREGLPYFLSYPLGYALVLGEDQGRALYRHRYPFINLGLTLVGTRGGKNLFAIDHLAAPRKFGSRLLRGQTMFVRSVHGFNDSRVAPTEAWQALPDWQAEDDLRDRFPYLIAAMAG